MQTRSRTALTLVLLALAATLTSEMVVAQAAETGRNYDARLELRLAPVGSPKAEARLALAALEARVPDLGVEYDALTGVPRTLYSRLGYLHADPAADPMTAAVDFLRANLDALGLNAADLDGYEVTDSVFSRVSGAHHIYLRQRHRGIPVYNGQLHVNVSRDGFIISVNNAFVPDLAAAVNRTDPAISAGAAVAAVAHHLGIANPAPKILASPVGPRHRTRIEAPILSSEAIDASLMWLPIRRDEVRLVWNLQLHTPDQMHMYDCTVDAVTGQTWTRFDWVADDSYRVYEQPVESPNHTSPLPPSDARTLAVDPADPVASPNGWHDTGSQSFTIMRGNNVHAYDDRDGNNAPPSSQPSCGASLDCDFPIDLAQQPGTHVAATLANYFYWSNLIHDVQYHYGFDEAAGNFQVNNFGRGGIGGDDVRAEAQDGAGSCNANFGTPPDGSRPRMQTFLCPNVTPSRDAALDNSTVIHEYGHGISNRQVGGPSNSSCLNNAQQGGEGWSDWWDQTYTIEVGDQGTDRRPDGTYFIGQDADGPGIRPQPYSTDPAINDYTYESINGLSVPHGVGSVWAQALWEVNWALIDEHGFDPNFFDVAAGAGNHRSMLYVNEGLKNTACSPTFTQARDGVIQAAIDNFGGEDVCLLWDAFANFGLGVNAISGGPNSTNPTNGFDVPPECAAPPPPPTACNFFAGFDGGADAFAFVDDPQDPAYTSGSAGGGAASISVGGVDDADISDMRGSWNRQCTSDSGGPATVTVIATLTQSADYEANELSQLALEVNGQVRTLSQLTGNGNGGGVQTSGPTTFTVDDVTFQSGLNTIRLVCFNNLKTFNNEVTTCDFDSVAVAPGGGGGGGALLTADFNVGTDGFAFADDPQDPAYTAGSRTAAGGVGGSGGLQIVVGGVDNADVSDMEASWSTGFSGSGAVTLTVAGRLVLTADYESNESGQLFVTVDGTRTVLAELTGDGNGGGAMDTGFQTFTVPLSLGAGSHQLSLGCFNNLKTFNNEQTTCTFDNVTIE